MSLLIRPKVKCPHCGHEGVLAMTIDSLIMNRFFVTCDIEEGGCDETFAIEVNLQTKVTTWKLEPVETVERELALDETKPVTTLMGRNVCLDCNGTGGVKP